VWPAGQSGGPLAVSGPMLLEARARLEHHWQPTWAADSLAPKIFRAGLRMWKLVIVIAFGAVCSLPGVAIAQQAQQPSSPPSASKESDAKPKQAGPQGTQVPDTNQLVILIRSTLLAVNHANLTGNYTVLRELGTPGFQQSNTAARLGDIFRGATRTKHRHWSDCRTWREAKTTAVTRRQWPAAFDWLLSLAARAA
jgi:hypothetical protein